MLYVRFHCIILFRLVVVVALSVFFASFFFLHSSRDRERERETLVSFFSLQTSMLAFFLYSEKSGLFRNNNTKSDTSIYLCIERVQMLEFFAVNFTYTTSVNHQVTNSCINVVFFFPAFITLT